MELIEIVDSDDTESMVSNEDKEYKRHLRLQYLAMMRTVMAFENMGEFGECGGAGLTNFGETYVYGSFVREYVCATHKVLTGKHEGSISTLIDTTPLNLNLFMVYNFSESEEDTPRLSKNDKNLLLEVLMNSYSISGVISNEPECDEIGVRYRGKLVVCLNADSCMCNGGSKTDAGYITECDDPRIDLNSGYFARINITLTLGSKSDFLRLHRDFDVNSLYQHTLYGEVLLSNMARRTVAGPYAYIGEYCKTEVINRLINKQCMCMIPSCTLNNDARIHCGGNDYLCKKTNEAFVRILRMLMTGYSILNIQSVCMYDSDKSSVCVICRSNIGDQGIGFSCCKRAIICKACISDTTSISGCTNSRLTRTLCIKAGHIKCVHCQSVVSILGKN